MALFTSLATSLLGIGIIGGAAAAGVTGGMMIAGASQKKPPDGGMQMPDMPKAPKMEDASLKAKMAADERRRAASRSDSVKSNPLGLKDEAEVVRKKLLGG